MLQCLRPERVKPLSGLYDVDSDKYLDCLLATGSRSVARDRAIERRAQINDLYRIELGKADFVFITLGLIECWYDEDAEIFLNEAPPRAIIQKHKRRFSFVRLNTKQCEQTLRDMLSIITDEGKKGIVTVSPVPLQVTFAGGDAITRNAYSKSVLRAACETVIPEFSDVDYFPSYEIAMSGGLSSFGQDNVHVRPIVVKHIIDYMTSLYLEEP
jgi:hypothetical protein